MIGTLKSSLFGEEAHKSANHALGIDFRRISDMVRPERCSQCVHRVHPEHCGKCRQR
jgi:hypothetical protein